MSYFRNFESSSDGGLECKRSRMTDNSSTHVLSSIIHFTGEDDWVCRTTSSSRLCLFIYLFIFQTVVQICNKNQKVDENINIC